MIIRKAFKFRLKTKPQIESKLSRFAGCCRFVWNKGLALQKQRLTQKQPCLSYTKMAAALRGWKNQDETAFLKDCHWQPLQQTLMALDKALQQAFDKKNTKRFPQFKKKGRHDALRYPQGFKLMSVHKWLFLPISLLGENFNPRNIRHMPAVKIFIRLKTRPKYLICGRTLYRRQARLSAQNRMGRFFQTSKHIANMSVVPPYREK